MKYFCEIQHDISDCAAACLVSIARYYGCHVRIAKVRELAGTDLNGTNINGILRAADYLGFEGNAVKCNKAALFSKVMLPCIAHVVVNNSLYHYVVIYKVTKRYILLADPGRGIVKVKPEVFCGEQEETLNGLSYRWSGVLVLLTKKESFEKKKSTTGRFFLTIARKEKGLLIKILLASILFTLLGLCGAIYYKVVIDNILPAQQKKMLTFLTIGVITTYAAKFVLSLLRSKSILHLSKKLDRVMFAEYMEHVLGLPLSFFERRKAGELVSRFNDADKVKEAISSVMVTVLIDGILVLIGLFLLVHYQFSMFLWAVFIIGVYVALVYFFNGTFERYNIMQMEYSSDLSSELVDTFKGIQTVKAYNMEEEMKTGTKKRSDKLLDCLFGYGNVINLQSAMEEFAGLVCGIVILWIGGMNVIDNKMTIGQLMLYYSLFTYFLDPIKRIVTMQPKMQTAVVAANRLVEIFEIEKEARNSSSTTEKEADVLHNLDLRGGIQFEHVTFGYRFDMVNIEDVSMQIQQGEKIAVIGENGSGKSTLFKLLLGLYPVNSGKIYIGGRNIEDISLTQLRERIGYVNQETFFFSDSIRNNLTYGLSGVTEEQVEETCKQVKIHDFIMELPFGYDTVLQENASNLSSGQRQRLALARAFLKNPDILILDEFTSNIDSAAEEEIAQLLNTCFKDRTIIFITHKIKSFSYCDRIYKMEKGKIVESGTFGEFTKKI